MRHFSIVVLNDVCFASFGFIDECLSLIFEQSLVRAKFTYTWSARAASLAQPPLFLPICVVALVASSASFYVATEHHSYPALLSRLCYNYKFTMHSCMSSACVGVHEISNSLNKWAVGSFWNSLMHHNSFGELPTHLDAISCLLFWNR